MASVDTRRVGDSAGGAFQPYLDSLRQELQQRDPTLLSMVVALFAVLLTLGETAGRRGEGRVAELESAVQAWEVGGEAPFFCHPPSRTQRRRTWTPK